MINKRLQESEKNKILEKDALPILKEASVEVLKYFERLIEKMSKRISPLLSGSTPTGEQVIVEVEEKLMEEFWRLTRKKKNRLLTKNWKSTKSQVEQKVFFFLFIIQFLFYFFLVSDFSKSFSGKLYT